MKKKSIVLGMALALLTLLLVAQEKKAEEKSSVLAGATIVLANKIAWSEGPASLPPGAQMMILDGDPTKEGPFTIRLKIPAGYKIPPHTHPVPERVTVISGTVHLGLGKKFDDGRGSQMKAGDFAVVPAKMAHYAWSDTEAVLQIHSEGPFARKLVNPADEPSVR